MCWEYLFLDIKYIKIVGVSFLFIKFYIIIEYLCFFFLKLGFVLFVLKYKEVVYIYLEKEWFLIY